MNLSDYQNAASLARACVETGAGVDKETLESAVKDMAAAVVEVNVRLREAGAELRANNIDQAVLLCEISPNLIESVEVLYLAEQDMWQQLVESQGLSLGEPLLVDVAGDLNEAYALQQPLAELMKRHRLLAIARAPLAERLAVLRKLNEVDPDNFTWQEDVEVFEKERHKHIANDVQAAAKNKDLPAARRLASELNETPWILSPDEVLARKALGLVQRLEAEQVYQQLTEIAQNIEQSYLQKDYDKAVALREKWGVASFSLRDDDPLWQTVNPVFEWIDEQDLLEQTANAHTKALIRLTRMLDRKEPLAAIDRQVAKAKKLGPVPVDLQKRIKDYRVSVAATKRGRKKIALGSLAAVLVLALIVFGWLWFSASQTEANREQIARIEKLFETHQYQQVVDSANNASRFVQETPDVSRWVAESQQILDRRANAEQRLIDALVERQKATAEAVGQAQALATDGNVSPAQIERTLSDIMKTKSANEANRSASIVGSDMELSRTLAPAIRELDTGIDRLNEQLDNAEESLQSTSDKVFLAEVSQLEEQYEDVNEADREKLASLKKEYIQLLNQWRGLVSQDAQWDAKSLGKNLDAASAEQERRDQYIDDVAQLSESVANRGLYEAAAKKFVESYGRHREATTRKQELSSDLGIWDAIVAYTRIVNEWNAIAGNATSKFSRSDLKEWEAAAASFVTDYPQFRESNAVKEKLKYSRRILERGQALNSISMLRKELDERVYRNINYFETPGGDWGYYREDPLLDSASDVYRFKVITDIAGKTALKSVKATPHPTLDEPAKHCKCIGQAEAMVNDVIYQPYAMQWEDRIWGVIEYFAEADQSADPLVRYKILRKMLETASAASSSISQVANDEFVQFDEALSGSVVWISQGSDTDDERQVAVRAIEELQGKLPSLIEDEKKIRRRIQASIIDRYKAIGILDQGGDKWVVRCRDKQNINEEVFVAGPRGLKGQLQSLGRTKSGTNELNIKRSEFLRVGRPVFIQETKGGS